MYISYDTEQTIEAIIFLLVLAAFAGVAKYLIIKDFYKKMGRYAGAKIFVGFNCLLDLSTIIMAIWAVMVTDRSGYFSLPLIIFFVMMFFEGLSMSFMMIVIATNSDS